MSWQSEVRAWGLAAAGLFCLGSIGYKVLTIPKLDATVTQLNGTLSNVNAATKAWSDASAQQVKSVAAIERDLRAQMWHVDRTLTTFDATLTVAQGAIGGIQQSAEAVRDDAGLLTGSVNETLGQAQVSIHGVQQDEDQAAALMVDLQQTSVDLNARVNDPNIAAMVSHWASMSASGDGIMLDARKLSDKFTADQLKPVPWYMYPVKKGSELIDIGAAVARHTP